LIPCGLVGAAVYGNAASRTTEKKPSKFHPSRVETLPVKSSASLSDEYILCPPLFLYGFPLERKAKSRKV
jgi:hypothetical protein